MIKIRKNGKLNIVMAAVLCAVLFFCFCSKSYVVQAADSSEFDHSVISQYTPYYYQITKKGFVYYDSKISIPDTYKVQDNIKIWDSLDGYSPFKEWTDKYYQNYSSDKFSDMFDVYYFFGTVQAGYKENESGDYTRLYVVVPKGTNVCVMKNGSIFVKDNFFAFRVKNNGVLDDDCYIYLNPNDYDHNFINYRQFGSDGSADMYRYLNVMMQTTEIFTNAPLYESWTQAEYYVNYGIVLDDKCKNKLDSYQPIDEPAPEKIGCDSIYWDDMTCQVTSVGSSKYAFKFDYTYSCSDLLTYPEDCYVKIVYNSDFRYQDGKGRVYNDTYSAEDLFSLSKHKNSFVNSNMTLSSSLVDGSVSDARNAIMAISDLVSSFFHIDSNFDDKTDWTVKSAKIYVTVFLYEFDHDEEMPGMQAEYFANSNLSSDVRSFDFDLFTLKEDTEGGKIKPKVTTEEVKDDDGNVVGKRVTDVVADDGGKTVINITVDNSNKVEDKNNNVNVPIGGGGSGSGDDDDDGSGGFWKYVTGIVVFFKALIDGNNGLFSVIAAFFGFIPKSFWTVVIGAVVIIAVVSIYKLAKK